MRIPQPCLERLPRSVLNYCHMQFAFQLDPVTKQKIKKSAAIAGSGFLVSAIPLLAPQLIEFFHDKPLLAAAIGAFSTWLVAAAREYAKGQ